MPNIFFDRSNDAGSGVRYDRTNDATAGIVYAGGAGVSDNASTPAGSAIGYALVTIAAPFDYGYGSIFFGMSASDPPVEGAIVRYPTTNGLVVASSGKSTADVNDFTWTYYYNDGSGEVARTLTFVPWTVAGGAGVTDNASAPTGSADGSGHVDAIGAGVTVNDTAPTGSGAGGAAVSGAGVTDTDVAPNGSAAGGAQASGQGNTDNASAPTGGAFGGSPGNASGAGVTVADVAPDATAVGGASAAGNGLTDADAAPLGGAQGAAAANGQGTTDSASNAAGTAGGAAQASGAGPTDTTSSADAGAVGGANAQGAGASSQSQAPQAVADPGVEVAEGSGVTVEATGPEAASTGGAFVAAEATLVESKVVAGDAMAIPDSVYARRIDMIKRFGIREIEQLTDRDDIGDIDDSVLSQALLDADAEINGYLQGRYTLPLAAVPRLLTTYACDIARYRLYDDRATEQVTKRYETALKFLSMVAQGKISLGVDSTVAAVNSGGPMSASSDRVFSMDSLKDFNA